MILANRTENVAEKDITGGKNYIKSSFTFQEKYTGQLQITRDQREKRSVNCTFRDNERKYTTVASFAKD